MTNIQHDKYRFTKDMESVSSTALSAQVTWGRKDKFSCHIMVLGLLHMLIRMKGRITIKTDSWNDHIEDQNERQRKAKKMRSSFERKKGES
jgi:hypothetical protein